VQPPVFIRVEDEEMDPPQQRRVPSQAGRAPSHKKNDIPNKKRAPRVSEQAAKTFDTTAIAS
jgi:hypothetical protein